MLLADRHANIVERWVSDRSISADLDVTAAAGMPSVAPLAQEEVKPRNYEGIGLLLLVVVTGLMILGGGWLVISADRLAGHRSA